MELWSQQFTILWLSNKFKCYSNSNFLNNFRIILSVYILSVLYYTNVIDFERKKSIIIIAAITQTIIRVWLIILRFDVECHWNDHTAKFDTCICIPLTSCIYIYTRIYTHAQYESCKYLLLSFVEFLSHIFKSEISI